MYGILSHSLARQNTQYKFFVSIEYVLYCFESQACIVGGSIKINNDYAKQYVIYVFNQKKTNIHVSTNASCNFRCINCCVTTRLVMDRCSYWHQKRLKVLDQTFVQTFENVIVNVICKFHAFHNLYLKNQTVVLCF